MKKRIMRFVGIFVAVFVALQLYNTIQSLGNKETGTYKATDFTLPTLAGDELSLHEQSGKVVILNFWATWCEPCKIEMPHFQEYYDQYAGDVEILAVNVTTKDSVSNVEEFIDTYGYTYPILLDEEGDVSTMYGAFTIPTTIIFNRDGEILHEIRGPLEAELLEQYVTPYL